MRLAVFGDIHGNLPALEAVLDDMKSCGEFDLIWCLGDLAAVGGQPRECVQRISALRADLGEEKVKIIGGNTDRYLVTGERMPFAPPKDKSAFAAYRDNILNMGAIYQWNLMQLGWDDFDLLRGILGRELQHDVERFGRVIGFHAIPGNDESTALRPDSPEEEAADCSARSRGTVSALWAYTPGDGSTGRWLARDQSRQRGIIVRQSGAGGMGSHQVDEGRANWRFAASARTMSRRRFRSGKPPAIRRWTGSARDFRLCKTTRPVGAFPPKTTRRTC